MATDAEHHPRRFRTHLLSVLVAVAAYFLSSGPMLGLAFWLREKTGYDQFYAVMWLYDPVVKLCNSVECVGKYVEWWVVSVFHTVGPG